jgi:hypothetical protein
MPFVQIAPKRFGGFQGIGQTKVTMGAYLSEGPKKPRQIVLRIPKAIIEEATSWSLIAERSSVYTKESVKTQASSCCIIQKTPDEDLLRHRVQTSRHPNGEDIESEQGYAVAFRFERFQYYCS